MKLMSAIAIRILLCVLNQISASPPDIKSDYYILQQIDTRRSNTYIVCCNVRREVTIAIECLLFVFSIKISSSMKRSTAKLALYCNNNL